MNMGAQFADSRGFAPIPLDGPFYDELRVGEELPRQPAVTLDSGICAAYQALMGERLPLASDAKLCEVVTGSARPLVSPGLIMALSVGHTTTLSRRVIANLFYRDVRMVRPVFVGETLSTSVRVLALRDSRPRPDRGARGLALVECESTADGELALGYLRCPMLPSKGDTLPGNTDEISDGRDPDHPAGGVDLDSCARRVPAGWKLSLLGPPDRWPAGETVSDPLRECVTNASALLHLTHNLAFAHRDAETSPYGRRLVNGLHVAGLAQASLSRALGGLATVLAWGYCSHTGPVFEEDLLSFSHTLLDERSAGDGRVRAMRVRAYAHRENETSEEVLDWTLGCLTP